MKLSKLHLLCGADKQRPIMSYVYVDDTNMVVTNGTSLARLKRRFIDDVVNGLPEGPFYIAKQNFKELTKDFNSAECHDGVITIVRKNGDTVLIPVLEPSKVGVYPNYNRVIREYLEGEQTNVLSLDAKLLEILSQAINVGFVNTMQPVLFLDSSRKAILVKNKAYDESDVLGLLMPCSID